MSQFPARPANALTGSQFIAQLDSKDSKNRDDLIVEEVLRGNFPDFMRNLIPITISEKGMTVIYKVTPDYLCVGNDSDYIRVPLGAPAAQRIADSFGCVLPTAKMSNQIWKEAAAKVPPKPMSGITSNISGQQYSPQEFIKKKMTDTDSFAEHNRLIQQQLANHRPGDLVAGHKKDVVISNELASRPDKVAIHGLHNTKGQAIQGGSWGHNINYRDYSHGIRLVDKIAQLNGKTVDLVKDILQNQEFAYLLSDEGALKFTAYKYTAPQEASRVPTNQVAQQVKPEGPAGRQAILQRISDYLDKLNKAV